MAIDRNFWSRSIDKNLNTSWTCPSCEAGLLNGVTDTISYKETRGSIAVHEEEAWDPEWIEYRFCGLLKCSNPDCKEIVSIAGTGGVDLNQTDWDSSEWVEYFHAKYVSPSPHLIKIPKKCPKKISVELKKSFSHFWENNSSAANTMRICVERILDHLGIPDWEKSTAHARILRIEDDRKEIRDLLLAVKWLGNTGSHGEEFSSDDIYDGLEILEEVLKDLFIGNERQRILDMAAKINKNKGPRRKNEDVNFD